MITKQEYSKQAALGYNRIPLVQELLADAIRLSDCRVILILKFQAARLKFIKIIN